MIADQKIWQSWANKLEQWGLTHWTVTLLEGAGSFTFLIAQFLYISQPMLRDVLPDKQIEALARMLEDTGKTRSFTAYLRQGSHS